MPSGRARYGSTPEVRFYQPSAFKDPWGGETTVSWWTADNLSTPYYLLPESVTDALGNTASVTQYNWQTLQPEEVMDANENLTVTACDALGMPVAMAVTGKGTEADYLTTLSGADILADSMSDASLQGVFWDEHTPAAGLLSAAKGLLGRATWRCIYRLDTGGGQPAAVAMIARELHYEANAASGVVIRISYSDGFGRVAMHKAQVADDESGNPRWVGSGKTVYNNKGKAVLQYEPYFSGTGAYDSAAQAAAMGVSPELYYDPLGRLYKTIMPDGSSSHTEWDGWAQTVWDANDTIDATWQHAPLSTAVNGAADEADAYNKALLHKGTPSMMYLDTLGRPFFTVQQHRQVDPTTTGDDPRYYSYETLDIMGNRLKVTDANGHEPLTYRYNLLKSPCYQYSIDGGEGLMLTDVGGQPLWHRDAELRTHRVIYDELRRVTGKEVAGNGSSTSKLTEKTVYADGPSADYTKNLRGMVMESYDGGGKHYVTEYDFKGQPLASYLKLLADYKAGEADWSAGTPPFLETQVFETSAKTDALGRMVTATDVGGYRTRHAYDKGGMLKSVYLRLPGATADDAYVQDIHYNAKGQRETIWYGNDTKVVYYYDALTQRLRRQATRKRSGISAWTDLADVYYYYDAVGNITRIRDEAADTYFTGNMIVVPLKDYTYDSLYRLTKAKGREQISNATYGTDDDYNDGLGSGTANSNALQNYMQYYAYDGAGNILSLSHDGASAGDYTRNFNYTSGTNRLASTAVGSSTYSYTYDARGNITSMPHLSAMGWNSNSELSMVVAGTTNGYYQYSGGQRIRKVIEKSGGIEERIYLGSYERYRKYDSSGTKIVERDTVHINDNTGRIAMLEIRTEGTDTDDGGTEQNLTRFIYSNHLQSSNLELNESGGIISYEEYHPYGTTAYQSKSSAINAAAKRYRYTGKERDEESGLNYHGARYYAPWLCRWTAVDPLESKYAGWSAYQYCTCNPIMNTDSTGMGNDDWHPPMATPKSDASGGGGVFGYGSSITPVQMDNHDFHMPQTPSSADNLSSQPAPPNVLKDTLVTLLGTYYLPYGTIGQGGPTIGPAGNNSEAFGEHLRNSPIMAPIGYYWKGEKGAALFDQIGDMGMAMATPGTVKGIPEPVSPQMEPYIAKTEAPLTILKSNTTQAEVSSSRNGSLTYTLTNEQAAKVNPTITFLETQEAAGGHAIEKHVGKTDAELAARLSASRKISGSSSFTDLATANRVVMETLKDKTTEINTWLLSGSTKNLVLDYVGNGTVIGRGIQKGQSDLLDLTNAKIILKPMGGNHFVLTAYPAK